MSFEIHTRCAQSGRPIRIVMDSDLKLESVSEGAAPFIFIPAVDVENIEQESIIDVF